MRILDAREEEMYLCTELFLVFLFCFISAMWVTHVLEDQI